METSRLFNPLKIGNIEVQHRIGMPSLTRLRATVDRIPTPLMLEYYTQRACVPGTLILAEGTFISSSCGGFPHGPGIWSAQQISTWRTITDAVHAKGCFIYCQLFAMGRAADATTADEEGVPVLAPSAIPHGEEAAMPRAMTLAEIETTIRDFANASRNAIEAGFDGVECHAANGYLVDQFLQDVSNTRTDKYGGSVANRSRYLEEVLQAMVAAVGADRVGLRLSPWSTFQGMKMQDPVPQFSHVVDIASKVGLAYLHLVESRISGASDANITDGSADEGLDFIYDLWDGPLLVAGGYGAESARVLVDVGRPDKDIAVMFGRPFISNPDLVYRIREGIPLEPYDRGTFYASGSPKGYSDYAYSKEYLTRMA